ncbi:MAG: YciI family protein [Sulfurifustaceae bacterium]
MKYVMFYETTPEGLAKARAHFPAHRARLDEFHTHGVLLMAGPLTDGAGGAIGIFRTREAAEEFVRGDPFVLNGVVSKWTIREWNEVLA